MLATLLVQIFGSKKLAALVATLVATAMTTSSNPAFAKIAALLGSTYFVGQGIADHGKPK